MTRDHRPWRTIPLLLWLLLAAAIALQAGMHAIAPRESAAKTGVPPAPPPAGLLNFLSLGDKPALARLMTLYLQSADYHAGARVPLAQLDFTRLESWLERILALDSQTQVPLLLATRIYVDVPDDARKRLLLDFTHRAFLRAPDRFWPWLAQAALLAKHRLRDPALALGYARALRQAANLPPWAQQLELLLLDDLGEKESARILAGALIRSGQLADPNEIAWVLERLGPESEARQNPDSRRKH